MAVRLHRASPLRQVERLHLAQPASETPAAAARPDQEGIETPRLGTPAPALPAFPPPPTVSLRPVKPIRIESPTRKLGKRVALGAGVVIVAAWIGASLGSRQDATVTMTASVLDAPRTIVADADGSLSSVAAVGAVLEPGSAIAEIAPAETNTELARTAAPHAKPADPESAIRIERELEQIARELSAARRAQVEIEKLYKSERATRSEREEAGAAVRALVAKRERLTAEREAARGAQSADAVADAAPVPRPAPAPATMRSDRAAIVREVLRETGVIKKGDPIAVLVSRNVRAAAPLAADAESPASAGDAARVTSGTKAFDATVIGVEIGPHGRQLVVEFDPGADRPSDGDAVEIRLAAERH